MAIFSASRKMQWSSAGCSTAGLSSIADDREAPPYTVSSWQIEGKCIRKSLFIKALWRIIDLPTATQKDDSREKIENALQPYGFVARGVPLK
jgi:hypothetical protein